ncbi:MAG: hypothetical protein ABJA64_01945 [Candidatus Saccharibacteria bacterium]
MKKSKLMSRINAIGGTVLALVLAVATVSTSSAVSLTVQGGVNSAKGTDQPSDLFGNSGIFSTITNTLLFILGAISVIMIIIGGLRYVISGGDSTAVTAAKNTILYAIVGVIVAVLAYAIINFVIGSFVPGTGAGSTGV